MEIVSIISSISRDLLYILIFTLLFVFFIKSNASAFIKQVYVVALSLSIVMSIISMLAWSLRIDAVTELFYWSYDGEESILYMVPVFLEMLRYFLIITGISFFIGSKSSKADAQYHEIKGVKRSVGLTLILFVLSLGLYFPFWLYRTVNDLRKNFPDDVPYTPAKAVGFLFIPIFNLFWSLYLAYSLPHIGLHPLNETEKSGIRWS